MWECFEERRRHSRSVIISSKASVVPRQYKTPFGLFSFSNFNFFHFFFKYLITKNLTLVHLYLLPISLEVAAPANTKKLASSQCIP